MKSDGNLNTDLYGTFNSALILADKEFTHKELIHMLKNGNIPEKQIAALKFDKITNLDDADTLLSCLTGCDGKIREAVAQTICHFLLSDINVKKIFSETSPQIFADATVDINGNICRYVIDSIAVLKNEKKFMKVYADLIVNKVFEAFNELDKFVFRDKKYVINKQIFKLYWCLEAIKICYEYIEDKILKQILEKSAKQKEYTIREKTAQILVETNIDKSLYQLLSNDENYYVRTVFLNH